MSAKNRVIFSTVSGIIALMLLFPPYEKAITGLRRSGSAGIEHGYGFIVSVASGGAAINLTVLIMQMAICLLIAGIVTICVK